MTNSTTLAVAQLGPINPGESRESVVSRLCALLQGAADAGANIVTFPELALTTFFPRTWVEEQEDISSSSPRCPAPPLSRSSTSPSS